MSNQRKDTGLTCKPVKCNFPSFAKPSPIGYFSLTSDRQYEPSASQLKYYKPPSSNKFPLDLNEGICLVQRKPESAYNEGLDHLLRFIFDNHERIFTPKSEIVTRPVIGAEFVCYRGALRRIMCIPYENRENLCINVTRYMGTFYLSIPDTEEDRLKRAFASERDRDMCSWGFKYEQFCLTDNPLTEATTGNPVDECPEFSCVFKTRLDGLELLYAAEMDGIVSDQPIELTDPSKLKSLKFVELKVRQGDLNQNQQRTFRRFKTRNWWCQSFLVGIEDMYVGMRTQKGLVTRIEHMEVRALVNIPDNNWDPSACMHFLIQFLQCLKTIMKDVNCPYTTYSFFYNAKKSQITYKIYTGKSEHSFLPDWYVSLLKRNVQQQ